MKDAPIAAIGFVAATICCVGHVAVLLLLGGAGYSALEGWANGAILILLAAAAALIGVVAVRYSRRSRRQCSSQRGD